MMSTVLATLALVAIVAGATLAGIPWHLRQGRATVARGAVVAGAVVLLSGAVATAPADAAPYGGCKEAWQAPRSAGANACRAHGWTVRPRVTANPSGRIMATTLRPCLSDDGSGAPCLWDATRQGNGAGTSFIAMRDGRIIRIGGAR